MKRIFAATAVLAATVGYSHAADLAARPYTKAPPPVVAPVYDWSGFYIGANGGWGTSRNCWNVYAVANGTVIPPDWNSAEGCHDASGGTVGGQIGYRWQAASWVFGLEAQGNWADFKGDNLSSFWVPPMRDQTRIDAFGLFTAQVGYSWNNFLLYVKGGAAVTRNKFDGFTSATAGGVLAGTLMDSASETRWGGTVGVGGEYAFAPNWSFAIEYNHLFMDTQDLVFRPGPNSGFWTTFSTTRTDHIRQDLDIVTARINYRFGGPVVAKY